MGLHYENCGEDSFFFCVCEHPTRSCQVSFETFKVGICSNLIGPKEHSYSKIQFVFYVFISACSNKLINLEPTQLYSSGDAPYLCQMSAAPGFWLRMKI